MVTQLPEAVKKRIELGDAMQQALIKKVSGQEEQVPVEEPTNAQDGDDIQAPDPDIQESVDAKDTQTDTTPTEPSGTGDEPVKTVAEIEQELQKALHKYNVLQGKYNAEVPRFVKQIKTLKQQLLDQETTIKTLKKEVRELKIVKPKLPETQVNPEDFNEYGSEVKSLANTVNQLQEALKVSLEENTKLTRKLGDLEDERPVVKQEPTSQEEDVEEVGDDAQYAIQEENFFSSLNMTVPDWRKINEDKGWLKWLGEVDPALGITRQEVLNDARKQLSVQRVTAIFNAYKRYASQDSAKKAEKLKQVEKQIQPKTINADTPPVQLEKKLWKRSEIKDFYKNKATGKYSAMPDGWVANIEAEIFSALREGRVKN